MYVNVNDIYIMCAYMKLMVLPRPFKVSPQREEAAARRHEVVQRGHQG